METNDWWRRDSVDFFSSPAESPKEWFVRAMMPRLGSDGRALYSGSCAGRVADSEAFMELAKSMGKLLMMPLQQQNYAGLLVSARGERSDRSIVIGLENGLLVLSSTRGNWWLVHALADSESLAREVIEKLEQQFVPVEDEPDRDIRLLVNRRGELVAERGDDVSSPLERRNYPAGVSEAFDRVVDFLVDPDPPGRLVLLEGPPGVGKTFFMRGLMHSATDCTYVYVPAGMLGALTGPTLMQVIMDLRDSCVVRTTVAEDGRKIRRRLPVVLIMEDADHGIVRRAVDNFSVLSEIANICDGFPGQILDVRVIATTNASRLDIDEAILRPGRLAHPVVFPLLEPKQAQGVYDRLTDNEGSVRFNEERSLAEVYQVARGDTGQRRNGRQDAVAGFRRG